MNKRTTIEIDERLLAKARAALGLPTIRATVEEALRRVSAEAEDLKRVSAEEQAHYFDALATRADLDVLKSEDMWR